MKNLIAALALLLVLLVPTNAQSPIGETFAEEVAAAGLSGLPFSWGSDGKVEGRARLSPAQNKTLDAVIAAHNASKKLVVRIDLATLQSRFEADGVWDTYVNFMFTTPARRNAFLRTMFIGRPVRADDAGLRTSMAGAGLTQAQIDKILR